MFRSGWGFQAVGRGAATLMIVCVAGVMAGCANVASFQTAEVLERGDREMGAGASFTHYNAESLSGDDEVVAVPAVNAWFRQGMGDGFEARAMAWFPLGWKAGVKYQLAGENGEEGSQLAVGGDLGHITYSRGTSDDEETVQIVDVYAPVYTGYRFGPRTAGYLTPQYLLRFAISDGDVDVNHGAVATLGVGLGERDRFFLEVSGGYETTSRSAIIQGGLGFSTGRW